jgi:hypothetical protein
VPDSTDWAERIGPDEAARHAKAAHDFVRMQKRKSERFGTGRALHRKPIVALRATLRVHEGLPPKVRHGLFEHALAHDAWLRLSNGGTDVQGDRTPDVRGFSMRVFGLKGPAALGGETDHQDFTLINHPAFAFPDSRHFVGLVLAASSGPAALLGWALRTYGPLGMFAQLKHMKQVFDRPFGSFATESFYSAAPLLCGPHAVRVRLQPPAWRTPTRADGGWAEEFHAQLAQGPLIYRLQLQFFVDEQRTPVEDASVDWPESVSPYLDVADLVVDPQPAGTPEADAFSAQVERSVFDPWQALAVHRPLGEVMRARKVVYYASQKQRGVA